MSDKGTMKGGSTEGDYTIRGATGVAQIAIGGTPTPGLVLAGTLQEIDAPDPTLEAEGYTSTAGDDTIGLSVLGFQVEWYPDPAGGFHAFGLVGYGDLSVTDDAGRESDSAEGPAVGGGLGYEWWVGEQWAIGVMGQMTYAAVTWKAKDIDLEDKHSVLAPALMFSATHH